MMVQCMLQVLFKKHGETILVNLQKKEDFTCQTQIKNFFPKINVNDTKPTKFLKFILKDLKTIINYPDNLKYNH